MKDFNIKQLEGFVYSLISSHKKMEKELLTLKNHVYDQKDALDFISACLCDILEEKNNEPIYYR